MRFTYCRAAMLSIIFQAIVGCGGGGGGSGGGGGDVTVKTATLKYYAQSSNPADQYSGFDLNVTLPAGSVLPTDAAGVPLAGTVFSSGQFAGPPSSFLNVSYVSTTRKLSINGASFNNNNLGEFITILVTVPSSYVPNVSDVITVLFSAYDSGGNLMTSVTADKTFN